MEQRINPKTYVELEKILEQQVYVAKKIPKHILNYIYEKASKSNYSFAYSGEDDILKLVDKQTLILYTFLYTKYVADGKQKNEIKEILIENENKKQQRLTEKYNPSDMFKKNQINDSINDVKKSETNIQMVVYKKGIWEKIKFWFSKLIRKK